MLHCVFYGQSLEKIFNLLFKEFTLMSIFPFSCFCLRFLFLIYLYEGRGHVAKLKNQGDEPKLLFIIYYFFKRP